MFLSMSSAFSDEGVRKAAVAGSFYENNPVILKNVLLRYLSDGKPLEEPVRLLICPHAGYVFSGPVAAKGYATIDLAVKRVIIVGPSHHKSFSGIAVPKMSTYETPLGNVPIDRLVVDKLKQKSGVVEAEGFDVPEHCLEVQLPFLQIQLRNFTIVPILTGNADPEHVASLLQPFFDATTAVIASSDLSHYEPQVRAKKIDEETVQTILSDNSNGPIEACGDVPIRVVMHLARLNKLKPVKIDVRTSYETAPQHCPQNRVVGYAAIAYVSVETAKRYAPVLQNARQSSFGEESIDENEKRFLLALARQSLEAAVRGDRFLPPAAVPENHRKPSGCFVTLTIGGSLRGCIGYIEPIKPLYEAVIDNARSAALDDPRFSRVTPSELAKINVEVSVLTKPVQLDYKDADDLLKKIVPGRDGVILRKGYHQSTYLPQVWEQLSDKVHFLEQLSLKAGMARDGWKSAEVKIYHAIHFKE